MKYTCPACNSHPCQCLEIQDGLSRASSESRELLSGKDEYELMYMLATQLGISSPESQEERNTSSLYQRKVLRAAIRRLKHG